MAHAMAIPETQASHLQWVCRPSAKQRIAWKSIVTTRPSEAYLWRLLITPPRYHWFTVSFWTEKYAPLALML